MNKYQNKERKPRLNFNIRCPTVRVVRNGNQLGIMLTEQAVKLAINDGLDLVEIAPQAAPPVCSIMDFEKYRYEQKQKEKEQKKNQKHSEIKELRLRPGIQDHDIKIKIGAIRRFLADGKKVQLNLQFKNREIVHKEEGFKVMNQVVQEVGDIANIERYPSMEGSRIICRLDPKPQG
jgi:translation initiation factor IF-3